jgi:hypothetical protein
MAYGSERRRAEQPPVECDPSSSSHICHPHSGMGRRGQPAGRIGAASWRGEDKVRREVGGEVLRHVRVGVDEDALHMASEEPEHVKGGEQEHATGCQGKGATMSSLGSHLKELCASVSLLNRHPMTPLSKFL